MNRNTDREELIRIAAAKVKQRKEKEEREDREFYERITSGVQWLLFKIVVAFCTLFFVATTIDYFFDGETKKIAEDEWFFDREWDYRWHKVLDVDGGMYMPHFRDWGDGADTSLMLTYSPIFKTGKRLSYTLQVDENTIRHHEELRQRSIFNWFPFLQIFLLIPLFTFIFKRQSAWFNFTRVASFVVIVPGILLIWYFSIM